MKRLVLSSFATAVFLLSACGDTVENINQTGMEVVSEAKDLPKCTDGNEGDIAFVKKDNSTRVCVNGEWFVTTSEGSAAADFSCKTEELKDKSGLKIVCNGDSIGVVLNGSDGKDGKQGEAGKDGDAGTGCEIIDRNDTAVVVKCGESTMTIDLNIGLPNDTAELDSERTPISLDSLVGFTQKGPFLKGSTVYLYELSDGRTLKQTNGNFTSNITQDNGRYKFLARDLVSQYAMVVVDGYYRNEITGKSSNAPIRLKAITDMRKRNSVNVNILTHLEFERVYHLVTKGDSTGKKLTVKQAKRQAQKEILSAFFIELDDNTDAEDMDVFGSSDADAALLAISILLQGDRTESEMMALLAEISTDMAEDGKWNGERADTMKAQIADGIFAQDLSKLRKNVIGWHLGENDDVGDFEKYVINFISKVYGIEPCSVASTERQTIQEELSIFNGRSYQCYEWENQVTWVDIRYPNEYLNDTISYGKLMDWRNRRMYHTIYIAKWLNGPYYRWTWLAENLDLDYRVNGEIYGTYCFNDSCDKYGKYGRLYTWAAAMDSAGIYSSDGVGCGFLKKCNSTPYPKGLCPDDWHIPTAAEWDSLIIATKITAYRMYEDSSLAARMLMSENGWINSYQPEENANGNNVMGFSLIPAGYAMPGKDVPIEYSPASAATDLWSSTDVMQASSGDVWFGYGRSLQSINDKRSRLSVRCIKD